MKHWDVFEIARSLQKGINRIRSFYSHPPTIEGENAIFKVTANGRRYEVRVREISAQEELVELTKDAL